MRSHEWIDRRSLAFDERIADKLAAKPELLQHAIRTLEHWVDTRRPNPPAAMLEWRDILLNQSLAEILTLLRSDAEDACRLRQSSPFCGILDPEERLAILREYEAKRA